MPPKMKQADAMEFILNNKIWFIENVMLITDKQRSTVPFTLNPIQRGMATSGTGRDVYVKPAQIGASSFFICDFLLDCLTIPGTVSIIISYDEFITGRLLRKATMFYNHLKERIPGLPKMEHDSTYEKTFQGMNSSFYICSAQSKAYGRGEAIHNLLIDEYAFWPQKVTGGVEEPTQKLWASAIQRVPLTKKTKIIFLSTPNGDDNDFFDMYMAAKEGEARGGSVYTSHFYHWYDHPEYTMLYTSDFVLPGDDIIILKNITPEETTLLRVFESLSISELESYNKLRWRRYKQVEMASANRSGETRRLFSQEYPEDDVSCFLSSGDQVYPSEQINDMAKMCYPAPVHHLFADIWYPPEDGVRYLLAIDPGEGKISESVGTVWKFSEEEFTHCATLSGFYEQVVMAEKCMDVARYYNGALIANEDALDMNVHIKDYPDIYYRTDPETGIMGRTIGWQTNKNTKQYMVTEVLRHFSKIKTHDIRLVSQFRNIRWAMDRTGKYRAIAMGADDYYDSCAIGIVCRTAMPIERGLVGTYGWTDKWGR